MDESRTGQIELNGEEQQLYERLGPLFEQERRRMAQADQPFGSVPASGPLFGQKEFELRDQVHGLGAKALEAAADERQKKGGIRGC